MASKLHFIRPPDFEPLIDILISQVTGQAQYPRLARMARDFLAIPGSSVCVERCLNIGRDVISLRRASLSAETIRLLMTFRAELLLEKRLAKATAHSVLKRNRVS